jgi:hypothetical protein
MFVPQDLNFYVPCALNKLNTRIVDLLPWAYATTPDLKAVA